MNNLAYASRDKDNVAPKVEELLRKELAAPAPVVYEVEDEGAGELSAGSVLNDVRTSLLGGSATPLFTIHFQILQPRAAGLDVRLNRQGVGCFAGALVYSAALAKPLGGEVSFGDDGKFSGDSAAAAKLNARKDLLKKCSAFAVTKGGLTSFELKIPRIFKITPHERGAEIVAVTLPRSKSMGLSATLCSGDFFELASAIEAAL